MKFIEKYDLFKQVVCTSNNPKDFPQSDLFNDICTLEVGNVSMIKSKVFTATK